MDPADIAWLQTAEGATAASEAATLLDGGSELAALRRLGRVHTPEQARAAVALALGRRVAAPKFEDAARLFCDREAAEQASSEPVARHLAARFASYTRVSDLGCGMGGDALALAAHARVLAVDRDPARLAMLAANAQVRRHGDRIEPVEADIVQWTPPPVIEAVWADPARRDGNGRRLLPESWSPPLSRILELADRVGAAGVKLAPGIDLDVVPAGAEVEFVSVDREIKAAVLWTGPLARAPRTATVLPPGESLSGGPAADTVAIEAPGRFLYDPDPTVGRAGLVAALARRLGAWKLDERIAYLSSDRAASTPFARRLRVRTWLPFSERQLVRELREAGIGRVEVTKRGSPVDTNDLERRLNASLRSGGTPEVGIVVLTRHRGRHIALVCEREEDAES